VRWHSTKHRQGTMAICPPSLAQEGQEMEGRWWLYGDYQALNICTIPDRYSIRHKNKYAHHLLKNWPDECISPNSCPPWRHSESCDHHRYTSWHFSISFYVLRPEEHHPNLSMIHGRDPERSRLLFHLRTTSLSSVIPPRVWPASPYPLTQLKTYGTLLNPSKCVFRVPEIPLLGHKTSS